MENYPQPDPVEVRRPRHRAEALAPIDTDAFQERREHRPRHSDELLTPVEVAHEQERRIDEAHEDLASIYAHEDEHATTDPAEISVPESQRTTLEDEHEDGESKADGHLNKLFPREVHGIKMTRLQSLLAGSVGRVAAAYAPDGILGRPPEPEFANPITRRIIYERAQKDEKFADYVKYHDESYNIRPKYSDRRPSMNRATQVAMAIPIAAADLMVAPVILTGIARKDSKNKLLSGIAKFHEKLENFGSKAFASKPSLYNLERDRPYRDPYDI